MVYVDNPLVAILFAEFEPFFVISFRHPKHHASVGRGQVAEPYDTRGTG
jgi:hypothetical protein